eukprot:1160675-Pelagomonas_calceolata.AAC.6
MGVVVSIGVLLGRFCRERTAGRLQTGCERPTKSHIGDDFEGVVHTQAGCGGGHQQRAPIRGPLS